MTGEFSLIITNVATNTEGDKTKVFAMSEGLSDIVTNDRRFTVEKRGDPEGIVAWRFISHEDQIDTEGAEREFVEFDPSQPYLWTATWNGFFNVRIQRGGATGPTVYNKGKGYDGAYDPDPHYAFIGSPIGRSGPDGRDRAGHDRPSGLDFVQTASRRPLGRTAHGSRSGGLRFRCPVSLLERQRASRAAPVNAPAAGGSRSAVPRAADSGLHLHLSGERLAGRRRLHHLPGGVELPARLRRRSSTRASACRRSPIRCGCWS